MPMPMFCSAFTLTHIVKGRDLDSLRCFGDVEAIAKSLESDAEKGIAGKEGGNLGRRRCIFGSNTHNRIFIVIFLVMVVTGMSNFRQDRQFRKLSDESSNITINVVRDGRHMTGENYHRAENPFLFPDNKVADSYAQMLVTFIGISMTWGEMMSSINREVREEMTLQACLKRLTYYVEKISLSVAAIMLTETSAILNKVADIFVITVIIIMVEIWKGLPLAITLTLIYSMKRMMADHAMVCRLSSCETMTSAATIYIDKIGTLTINQMKVDKFPFDERLVEINPTRAIADVRELLH
ncbi:hypothetical protein ACLOJK_035089 [Asimina triloba]